MKRVKIMLLSLTLLAIVGGALAFKAKYALNFCTTTDYIADVQTTCPSLTTHVKTTTALNKPTFYTTIAPNLDCTFKENGIIKPITCNVSTSVVPD